MFFVFLLRVWTLWRYSCSVFCFTGPAPTRKVRAKGFNYYRLTSKLDVSYRSSEALLYVWAVELNLNLA